MTYRIIVAGEGGQGVMFLGRVLAEAALSDGTCVTWLPSYGAEVRGGTANCMVTVSDEEIGSPFIGEADALIILNEPSMARFSARLKKKGLLVVNASRVPEAAIAGAIVEKHRFTDIALSLGSAQAANMVALGCFVSAAGIVRQETVRKVITDMAPQNRPELAKLNADAFVRGVMLAGHKDTRKGRTHGPR